MTQDQRNTLQRAAWQHRPDLERAILAEIEHQEHYPHATTVYHPPARWRAICAKIPAAVWLFLAAAIMAVIILTS